MPSTLVSESNYDINSTLSLIPKVYVITDIVDSNASTERKENNQNNY
jgi:hypothetical protein